MEGIEIDYNTFLKSKSYDCVYEWDILMFELKYANFLTKYNHIYKWANIQTIYIFMCDSCQLYRCDEGNQK